MQQLELQIGQLEAQLHEVQLQVGLHGSDRYELRQPQARLYEMQLQNILYDSSDIKLLLLLQRIAPLSITAAVASWVAWY